jgi:hypothetical protein
MTWQQTIIASLYHTAYSVACVLIGVNERINRLYTDRYTVRGGVPCDKDRKSLSRDCVMSPRTGIDTRTDRLTDRQSQRDLDLSLEVQSPNHFGSNTVLDRALRPGFRLMASDGNVRSFIDVRFVFTLQTIRIIVQSCPKQLCRG